MALSFTKKETRFSTLRTPNKETFIYKLFQKNKHRLVQLFAPVKNHEAYDTVRNVSINMSFTALVTSFVCWCFMVRHPLRVGVGIAVTLYLLQYYTKWYFSVKK